MDRRPVVIAIVAGGLAGALGNLINLFFVPGELIQWRALSAIVAIAGTTGLIVVRQWKRARRRMSRRTRFAVLAICAGVSLWALSYQPLTVIAAKSGFGQWESFIYPIPIYGLQVVALSALAMRDLELKYRIEALLLLCVPAMLMIGASLWYWTQKSSVPVWLALAVATPPSLCWWSLAGMDARIPEWDGTRRCLKASTDKNLLDGTRHPDQPGAGIRVR